METYFYNQLLELLKKLFSTTPWKTPRQESLPPPKVMYSYPIQTLPSKTTHTPTHTSCFSWCSANSYLIHYPHTHRTSQWNNHQLFTKKKPFLLIRLITILLNMISQSRNDRYNISNNSNHHSIIFSLSCIIWWSYLKKSIEMSRSSSRTMA